MEIAKQHVLRSVEEVTGAAETLATTIVYSDIPHLLKLTIDCADAGLMVQRKLEEGANCETLMKQYINICDILSNTYELTLERQLKRTAEKCKDSIRLCTNYLNGTMGKTTVLQEPVRLSA